MTPNKWEEVGTELRISQGKETGLLMTSIFSILWATLKPHTAFILAPLGLEEGGSPSSLFLSRFYSCFIGNLLDQFLLLHSWPLSTSTLWSPNFKGSSESYWKSQCYFHPSFYPKLLRSVSILSICSSLLHVLLTFESGFHLYCVMESTSSESQTIAF